MSGVPNRVSCGLRVFLVVRHMCVCVRVCVSAVCVCGCLRVGGNSCRGERDGGFGGVVEGESRLHISNYCTLDFTIHKKWVGGQSELGYIDICSHSDLTCTCI